MNAETILEKLVDGRNIHRLDKMLWVGKNYSMADLKADLESIVERKDVYIQVTPSLEFIQLDCVVTKEGVEFKEMKERVKKASKSANANALSQMGGEGKC